MKTMNWGNLLAVLLFAVVALGPLSSSVAAYSNNGPPPTPAKINRSTRRDLFGAAFLGSTAALVSPGGIALAFEGGGASASSGYNPATKREKQESYKKRIIADVHDFNTLGTSIDSGETEGPAWIDFFIQQQRRQVDSAGRAYAALADLRGVAIPGKKNEFEGGDGFLLANTFTKQGKPPDNTPAVKSFRELVKAFDPIERAGKKGDAAAAKAEWNKAKILLSKYLSDVDLPSDLDDAVYK